MTDSRSYKITVRFNTQEMARLSRYRGDAPLTTYVRLAALRDTDRKEKEESNRATSSGPEGGLHNPPPFGGKGV